MYIYIYIFRWAPGSETTDCFLDITFPDPQNETGSDKVLSAYLCGHGQPAYEASWRGFQFQNNQKKVPLTQGFKSQIDMQSGAERSFRFRGESRPPSVRPPSWSFFGVFGKFVPWLPSPRDSRNSMSKR